ncbi:MAG: HTH domain-containing protein [Myxococcota bacterium]
MTFTEAAVEVLKLAQRPLHYKKITEIAIERNLLSHVGKTPEITMSSRLATMVKKDVGEAPIVKVKPGVFGLREFDSEVLQNVESSLEYALPPADLNPTAVGGDKGQVEPASTKSKADSSAPETSSFTGNSSPEVSLPASPMAETSESKPQRQVPGADLFPEEDDDDDLILAKLNESGSEDGDAGRKRKRRRRRRRRSDEESLDTHVDEDAQSSRSEPARRDTRSASNTRREGGRGTRRDLRRDSSRPAESEHASGDWNHVPDEGDVAGADLSDAVFQLLKGSNQKPRGYTWLADQLVRRGRLAGSADALVPTIAAAVRGDIARSEAGQLRPRFRVLEGQVHLSDWLHPGDALRAEGDVWRSAHRQRSQIRRSFVRTIAAMPATGFMELLAVWLNRLGVTGLRGVRRPSSGSDFHLAGTLCRGPEEIALAIVVVRNGGSIGREHIIDARGALHHYGNAKAAWIVTTGQVLSGAREEAVGGQTGVITLFDGMALATSMEESGVGIRRHLVPIAGLDLDLLEGLGAELKPEAKPDRRSRNDTDRSAAEGEDGRRRRRRRRDDPSAPVGSDEEDPASSSDDSEMPDGLENAADSETSTATSDDTELSSGGRSKTRSGSRGRPRSKSGTRSRDRLTKMDTDSSQPAERSSLEDEAETKDNDAEPRGGVEPYDDGDDEQILDDSSDDQEDMSNLQEDSDLEIETVSDDD